MPPIPTKCQPIATQLAALQANAQTLRTDAQAAVGQAAWTKLGQLATVLQDIDRTQAELDACIAAHTGDVVYEVAFIDGGGGPATGDRVAHLWDMSVSPPSRIASVPVEGGNFAFTGPMPAGSIAVGVEGTVATAGPDFRSGPFPVPAAASSPRIEIVTGPTVKITADDLTRWLSLLSFEARRIDTGQGTLEVTATSIAAALGPGSITLSGVGTVSRMGMGAEASTFSASVSIDLVPSTTPAGIMPIEPKKLGNPELRIGGPLAILGAFAGVILGSGLWDVILNQVREIARDQMAEATARALSLAKLPPDTTLSLRSVSITPSGITFQPMLGAFGTTLSTYQPTAADMLPP
jgi:hypothetical protein